MSTLSKYTRQAIVSQIMQDIPKVDSDKLKAELQEKLYKGMSAPCRALYRKNPKALSTNHAGYSIGLDYGATFFVGDADWKSIVAPYEKAQDARRDLRHKLESALSACKTRKQFVDRFPEFTQYLPKDDTGSNTNLPAIANLISDLVKAGWSQKVFASTQEAVTA